MPDHLNSVKEYMRFMEGWRDSARAKGENSRVLTYDERIEFFQQTVDEIEELRRITKPIPASYGDISDLPSDLVKELTGIKVDDLEKQIFNIVQSGDEVDLDAVLIELFRRHEVLQTRKFLQNKLWRMAQRGLIHSVAGKKGVYSAKSPVRELEKSLSSPFGAGNAFDSDLDDDVPF